MTYTYESKAVEGHALSLGSGRLHSGYRGVVIRSDGKEVYSGPLAYEKRHAVLHSNKALAGFRWHMKSTGRCWFDDEEAKRKAKSEWKLAYNELENRFVKAVCRGIRARTDGKNWESAAIELGYETQSDEWAAFAAAYQAAGSLPPKPPKA